MADIKLLDCTLRDGGYVNNWQWGFGSARRIIQTLTRAGVDIVEGADLPALESDLAQAKALLDALMAHDWDRSVEASRNISFARLGSTRKFDDKEFL